MTMGRKLRLALGAAILAVLFVFVTVGHAGVHVTGPGGDPPCAMCAPAWDGLVPSEPEAPAFAECRVLACAADAPRAHEVPLEHPSRGPPSAG